MSLGIRIGYTEHLGTIKIQDGGEREERGKESKEKHKCRTFQSFTFVHNSENTGGEAGGSSFCSLPLPAPISILFRSARIGIRIGV